MKPKKKKKKEIPLFLISKTLLSFIVFFKCISLYLNEDLRSFNFSIGKTKEDAKVPKLQ